MIFEVSYYKEDKTNNGQDGILGLTFRVLAKDSFEAINKVEKTGLAEGLKLFVSAQSK